MNYLKNLFLQFSIFIIYFKNSISLSLFYCSDFLSLTSYIKEIGLGDFFEIAITKNREEVELLEALVQSDINDPNNIYRLKTKLHYIKDTITITELYKSDEVLGDILLTLYAYNLRLKKNGYKKLKNFLSQYISNYREDKLTPRRGNFYPYAISLKKVLELFKKCYEDFGPSFNFNNIEDVDSKYYLEGEARIYEIMLFFLFKNYISINNFSFNNVDSNAITINLTLNKTPYEIENLEASWISYGDIKINVATGETFYKNNFYRFKPDKNTFSLLAKLIKNPGKKLDLYSIFDELSLGEKDFPKEMKKTRIVQYIKEIKRKLKIKALDATIKISISGSSYLTIYSSK